MTGCGRAWKTRLWTAGAMAVAGTGMAGCTEEQLNAVLAGVQVAAGELSQEDEDVSLRDWLSSELEDD